MSIQRTHDSNLLLFARTGAVELLERLRACVALVYPQLKIM